MNFHQWMAAGVLCAAAVPLAAYPRTEVKVSRPTTSVSVSRPSTSVAVFHPKTEVKVFRPSTSVQVTHPTTDVSVSRPQTTVTVNRPATSGQSAGQAGGGTSVKPGAAGTTTAGGKKAAAESSASAKTSMSGYQPPKAKDFKAAPLGGGSGGLGNKTDEAAKDAAAAAFNVPKGDEVSLESVLKNAKSINTSKITKAVEKQAK